MNEYMTADEVFQENEKRRRVELIQGLRDLAQFLVERPDAPTPYCAPFNAFVGDAAEMKLAAKAIGNAEKQVNDDYLWLERSFGGIKYHVNVKRDAVCERVVIGQKVVPAEPEKVVDVVEWRCGEVLR